MGIKKTMEMIVEDELAIVEFFLAMAVQHIMAEQRVKETYRNWEVAD